MKRVLLFFLVCGCSLSSAPGEIPNGGGPIPAPGDPPVVFPPPPPPGGPCDPIRPAPGLVYTVQGRLTEDCGSQQPLSLVPLELRIKARAGVYTCDPIDPFPQTHTREFFVAAGQTDADGRFSITFLSDVLLAEIPSGYSFLTQLATLKVFAPTGAAVMAQTRYASPDASRVYTIDQDFPVCLTDTTSIQVVDSSGDAVIGAEVFINGVRHPEKTGSRGFVYVVPAAATGATIVARARIHENQSPRDAHDAGSTQDWNYRVYKTSLTLDHDGAGNGVSLDPMAVTTPVATYVLRLDRTNAMIGFHLRASVEWDATAEELSVYRQRIIDFSELMYNATDGQFFVEQVELEDDSAYWDEADMRIFATINRRTNARLDGMRSDGGHINLNPNDARISPDMLLHEFGHYGFDLGDEYTRGSDWRPEYGIPVCTHKSLPTAPSSPFENNGPKDACIMRVANTAANIKICSNHPDNPHTLGTAQGEQDCWTDLADQFRDTRSGSPRWILRTPNTRGEIIGQLPFVNSNGLVPNYTRLAAWQTRVEVVNHQRTNVCVGGLPVPNSPAGTYRYQAILNGVPVNGAEVFLETTYGQWIPQGLTRDNPFVDGTTFRPGEIIIRGAHAGDTLHTQFPGSSIFITQHTITARECENTGLVIASNGGVEPEVLELSLGAFDLAVSLEPTSTFGLHRVLVRTEAALIGAPIVTLTPIGGTSNSSISMELDPATQDYVGLISNSRNIDAVLKATAVDIDGNSVTQLTHAVFQVVDPAIELALISVDGGLEMRLPAGAVATPGHIKITRPDDLPPIPAGLQRVAGPYGVQSSTGDALQAPAVLFFPLTEGPDAGLAQSSPDSFEVLEFDPNTQQWLGLDPLVQADPAAVTAETTRLTAYVLAIRTADINEPGFGANGPDEEGDPADPAALLPAAGGGSGVCGSGAAVATPLMLACLCIRTRRRVGPVSR